jgi:hypothetical protein
VDDETRDHWSKLAEPHERVVTSCRSVSEAFTDSEQVSLCGRFERSVESYATAARRMVAEYRRIATVYRTALATPWPRGDEGR